jgi:hypothetical protein
LRCITYFHILPTLKTSYMKKIALLSLVITALFSCSEPAPAVAPETVITGVITNPDGNTVWIESFKNEKIKIDTLNEKGEFEIKLTLAQASCFELVNGKSKSYLCLAPADTLSVTFDSKNIKESILYNGKSMSFNNYLCQKQRTSDKLMNGEYSTLYGCTCDTFLINADLVFGLINAPFNNIKADTNINETLISKEEEALKYEKAALLLDYNRYHKMIKMVDSVAGIEKVLDLTKDLNPNKAADLELLGFRNYLKSYIDFNAEEVYKADTTLHSAPDGMMKAKALCIDKMISDAAVKEYLQNKLKAESPAM